MPRPTANIHGALPPLFPFLAVFICAAGALATLVYGYEQRGLQLSSEVAKAAAALAEADEVASERDGIEWRIAQLQQAREKTQQQLADKQRELSHVEDHLRRLREQADRLRLSVEELRQQDGARTEQSADAEAELERLRRAIAKAERELLEQERAGRDRPVTYSVVPYEGPNQTKRRPIYIECRNDSVVLQPEGTVFGEHDFDPPLGPGNPLAAAIRAYCEYLNQAGFTGETTRPYPLLLVRPDGIEAYYAARAALQSWGTEFGYELIGADWKLDFPPREGRLAENLQQVVADARARKAALAIDAPRQYKRPRGGLRASSRGGFVADGEYEGSSRYGGSRFADRQGRGNGFGSGSGSRREKSGWGAEPGGSGSEAGGRGSARDGFGSPSESFGGSGNAPSGNDFAGSTSNGGSEGGIADAQRSPTGGTSGERPGTGNGPQLGSPGGQPGGASGASQNALAGEPGGAAENKLGPLGTPGQGFRADAQQTQAAGSSGSSSMGGQSGEQSASESSGSGSAGGAPGDPSSSQTVTAQVPPNKPKSLASKRGRDWGLPDASANTTAVTRPVIIRCEPNQLTIMPDDNRSLPKNIPLGARTEGSVDSLVSGVWDHMKGWGLAGRGLYWRPTLVMEVAPGAETRFAELQSLLLGSGLEVKQRGTK